MNLYCKHQIANNDTYRSHYDEIDWTSDIRTLEVQGDDVEESKVKYLWEYDHET